MPQACTLMRTSPGPGATISRSTNSNSPPPLLTCATIFFAIVLPLSFPTTQRFCSGFSMLTPLSSLFQFCSRLVARVPLLSCPTCNLQLKTDDSLFLHCPFSDLSSSCPSLVRGPNSIIYGCHGSQVSGVPRASSGGFPRRRLWSRLVLARL